MRIMRLKTHDWIFNQLKSDFLQYGIRHNLTENGKSALLENMQMLHNPIIISHNNPIIISHNPIIIHNKFDLGTKTSRRASVRRA